MASGLVGWGGQVLLTIGESTKAVGNLQRWRAELNRSNLDTTTQADEDATATPGLRSVSGQFEFVVEFYESAECWSAYQLIDAMLSRQDDTATCLGLFRIQQTGEGDLCRNGFQQEVYLWGKIIPSFSLSLDPSSGPVVSVCRWQAAAGFQISEATQEEIDGIINIYLETRPDDAFLPPGGTLGQVLVKASDNDYDAEWQTLAGGGGPIGLGDLIDVSLASPTTTNVLRYQGSNIWANQDPDLDGGVFL